MGSCNEFKLLCWNANGLQREIHELRNFVIDCPVDVILIQEVRSKVSKPIKIQNFNLFHSPRTENGNVSPFGGTAVYINRRVPHHLLPIRNLNCFEATCVQFYPSPNYPITIASVYRRSVLSGSNINLTNDLTNIFNLDDKVLIAGDFNAHHAAWVSVSADQVGISIYNYCTTNGLEIHSPTSPTRFSPLGTSSNIDFAISKNLNAPISTLTHSILRPPAVTI